MFDQLKMDAVVVPKENNKYNTKFISSSAITRQDRETIIDRAPTLSKRRS